MLLHGSPVGSGEPEAGAPWRCWGTLEVLGHLGGAGAWPSSRQQRVHPEQRRVAEAAAHGCEEEEISFPCERV